MHGKAGRVGGVARRFGTYALRVSVVCAIAAIATAAVFTVGVAGLVAGQKVEKLLSEAEQVVSLVDQATFGGELSGAVQALGLTHGRIKDLVNGTLAPDDPETLRDLGLIRDRYKASIVYVLDASGSVVACTPYDSNSTLTGNNYSFRPYFQRALNGKNLVYPAVGVTTGKRGLYFAAPVYMSGRENPSGIGGVVVAKMGLAAVDQVLESWPNPLAVVSPSGIVFSSNRWEWVRRNGTPPGGKQAERILKSRQFGEHRATELYALKVGDSGPRVTLPDDSYLRVSRPLALEDTFGSWRLVFFQQAPDVQVAAISLAGWVVIAWLYFGIGLNLVNRRQRHRLELEKDQAGKEAEETYKSIFDSANDAILVHELGTGRIVDANEQCLDQFGYTPAEIKSRGVHHLSSGEPPYSKVEAARWIEAAGLRVGDQKEER